MRTSSRLVLLAAIGAAALLSGTAMALAQDDDDDDTGVTAVLKELNCNTVSSELIGECNEETPPAETPPAGDTGGGSGSDGGTPPSPPQAPAPAPRPSPTPTTPLPASPADASNTGDDSDEDNGAAPVGWIETGAGGTANDGDTASLATLAGGSMVIAGGVVLVRRAYRRTRHVR